MHILIVNNTVIPALEYGGVERIIWWLGKELVRLGHRVSFLVKSGSSCPFADVLIWDENNSLNDQVPDDVDFIHMCFQTKEELKKPYLMMHQYNYHPDEEFDINTVFASKNQAERNGSVSFVWNGVDPDEFGPVDFEKKRKYLLFLGWASRPEKNVKSCLEIAKRTNNVLAVVGGKKRWYRWRPWAEYKGFIGGEAKLEVMRQSKALLFPVRWHEPCAVSIFESLYFGCPVIGSKHGCLPELVLEDLGFLSNSCSDLVDVTKNLDRFDPKHIHEYTCENLSAKRMTQNYLNKYDLVLSGQNLNPSPPKRGENFSRESLLPFYK